MSESVISTRIARVRWISLGGEGRGRVLRLRADARDAALDRRSVPACRKPVRPNLGRRTDSHAGQLLGREPCCDPRRTDRADLGDGRSGREHVTHGRDAHHRAIDGGAHHRKLALVLGEAARPPRRRRPRRARARGGPGAVCARRRASNSPRRAGCDRRSPVRGRRRSSRGRPSVSRCRRAAARGREARSRAAACPVAPRRAAAGPGARIRSSRAEPWRRRAERRVLRRLVARSAAASLIWARFVARVDRFDATVSSASFKMPTCARAEATEAFAMATLESSAAESSRAISCPARTSAPVCH